jgi:signal transduction histidine kinase
MNTPSQNQTAPPAPAGFFQEISIEYLVHELKDPIAVIEVGLRSLLEKTDKFGALNDRQVNILKRSLRNTRKAWALLNDLLEVGRSESGCRVCRRFRPADALRQALKEALETVTGPVAEAIGKFQVEAELFKLLSDHGVQLQESSEAACAEMLQDEVKFRQIAGNLFKNAMHHRRQRMEVSAAVEGRMFVLAVKDDGPGVDPELHQFIFQRYTQVKECALVERRGHGLGLAGSLIMARSLGGDILVESRKGAGATFRLVLPLHLESPEATETGAPPRG